MGSQEVRTGPRLVVTAGSTTTTNLVIMTEPIDGRLTGKVRFGVFLDGNSGNAKVRPRCQTSEDGVTWTTESTFSSYTTYIDDDGWTWGTAFDTVPPAPHTRFGLQAINDSGTKTEAVRAEMIIDLTYGS